MNKKWVLLVCSCFLFLFTACTSDLFVPETVVIEGVTYRNGFYGNLWPIDLQKGNSYEVDGNEFRRVACEQFDWVHSSIGSRTNGVLYCAEDQWEQAKEYYADNANFEYYCEMGSQTNTVTLNGVDGKKLDALLEFAEKNGHKPLESKDKNKKAYSVQIPENKDDLVFYKLYKKSKDGFFSSFKGDSFYVFNGKLTLLYYYDHGYGEYEEVLVLDIPDEIGSHFVELLK